MAIGHGAPPNPAGLDKGKSPLVQASVASQGPQGNFFIPNTFNSMQMAPPSFVGSAAMAANSSVSAPPVNDRGAGPSVPPPQGLSKAFPPLAQAPKASQAKKRRFREARRRPHQQSTNSNIAFNIPASGNAANSGPGHTSGDTWPEFQSQFAQPMAAQQHLQSHVPMPDMSLWQQGGVSPVFPPGFAQDANGSRRVANPPH